MLPLVVVSLALTVVMVVSLVLSVVMTTTQYQENQYLEKEAK